MRDTGPVRVTSVLLLCIIAASCVMLAGCDNAGQASFKKVLRSLSARYDAMVKEVIRDIDKFTGKVDAIVKAGGGQAQADWQVSELVATYDARLKQLEQRHDQLAAEIDNMPTLPEYALAMSTVSNGTQLVSNAIQDTERAVEQLTGMAGANEMFGAAGVAKGELKQGLAYVSQGSNDIFRVALVLLIMFIGIAVTLDIAFGHWSGQSAKGNGRKYWPAFALGILLGPVGFLITLLLNRRHQMQLQAPPPVPGYLLPDLQPLVGEGAPLQGPAVKLAPPEGEPREKTPTGNKLPTCPHCGARIMNPPFCPSCGKMLGL